MVTGTSMSMFLPAHTHKQMCGRMTFTTKMPNNSRCRSSSCSAPGCAAICRHAVSTDKDEVAQIICIRRKRKLIWVSQGRGYVAVSAGGCARIFGSAYWEFNANTTAPPRRYTGFRSASLKWWLGVRMWAVEACGLEVIQILHTPKKPRRGKCNHMQPHAPILCACDCCKYFLVLM